MNLSCIGSFFGCFNFQKRAILRVVNKNWASKTSKRFKTSGLDLEANNDATTSLSCQLDIIVFGNCAR